MNIITRELTQQDLQPVIKLAVANHIDLTSYAVRRDGPISGLSKGTLEIEVRTYLQQVLSAKPMLPVEVVLAKDPEGAVIGFMLVIRAANGACGLSYGAVAQSHRQQGVLRLMLDDIKSRHQSIVLTCHLGTVHIYERLGFKVSGQKDAQVEMSWGPYDPLTPMNHLGFESHVEFQALHAAFKRTHGTKAISIRRAANAFQAARVREVAAFVAQKLQN
ncbi:hypothetical protein NL64_06355 [Pseudomonas fluorescens]|uniref:GNAT family N-acetyltransferase n=1 Tax=Pseudomonas fluorescens TaxID=294 RepID=UPI00054C7EB7|nr:GNAT family N-acetyltransferase [Pseudomonas fluorescens]KII34879.1 hypothetical protein NL64_06355 [Pseudomonas fluorescens]